MIKLDLKWFPFLSDSQFQILGDYLSDNPIDFMAHQLAVLLGAELSVSISIISVLNALGFIDVKLLIYHICDPELAVGAIPFQDGYPKLPFYCEECDTEVSDLSELNFDLLAVLKSDN